MADGDLESLLAAAARGEASGASATGAALEALLLTRRSVEGAPAFVVIMDPQGKVVDMNRTMLGALGYTREEVLGRDYMATFVPADEHPQFQAVAGALASPGTTSAAENHVLTRDGRKILVEWHGGMLRDAEGRVQAGYGFGIEASERQRIRSALRRTEQRLALHFEQASVGMIDFDEQHRVIEWNPAAERIFGYSREEALGRRGPDLLVPPVVRAQIDQLLDGMEQGKMESSSVNENITKDGRTIICEWKNTALYDESGRFVGLASLITDVTERHRAEEERKERERAQAETLELLSAPIIDLWEGVLALPVIGAVDQGRAERMTASLLEAIVQSGASFTIVDLTGSTAIDAATAAHLTGMVRAAGLLGTRCLVSGLSPAMARTLVELDADLGVPTFGTLRAALRHAIDAQRARRVR